MAKSQELLIDGKTYDPSAPSERLLKLQEFLDRASDNEVFTTLNVVTLSSCSQKTAQEFMKTARFESYTYRRGNVFYFGNPKAITLLKSKLGVA